MDLFIMYISILAILSLLNIHSLVLGDLGVGEENHIKFDNKYLSLINYFEWDVLKILKNATLKNICVQLADIQRSGIRGEAKVKKHIRSHIIYNNSLYGDDGPRTVRLDLLQCQVTFIDCNNNTVGKKSFYLAEGSEENFSIFKLCCVRNHFYLVGEIRSKAFIDWFSKENLLLEREEAEAGTSKAEEEFELQWDIWNSRRLLGKIAAHEEGSLRKGNVPEENCDVPEVRNIPETIQNRPSTETKQQDEENSCSGSMINTEIVASQENSVDL